MAQIRDIKSGRSGEPSREPTPRRLAAIVAGDISGYSRLMQIDEEGTHNRVKRIERDLIEPSITEHHGKLVKTTGDGFIASTGREVVRAVLVSGGLTAVLKGAVGRTRPFASPGDADEYNPGHGFLNSVRGSFPSGHTSAAFAAATVLIREMDVAHPHARPIAVPLLLGSASFVGLSRVYDRQHWPSDVVVGAAIGSITGYEVVAHAHGDRSRIDLGFLSHLVMSPQKSGMQLGWSLR